FVAGERRAVDRHLLLDRSPDGLGEVRADSLTEELRAELVDDGALDPGLDRGERIAVVTIRGLEGSRAVRGHGDLEALCKRGLRQAKRQRRVRLGVAGLAVRRVRARLGIFGPGRLAVTVRLVEAILEAHECSFTVLAPRLPSRDHGKLDARPRTV